MSRRVFDCWRGAVGLCLMVVPVLWCRRQTAAWLAVYGCTAVSGRMAVLWPGREDTVDAFVAPTNGFQGSGKYYVECTAGLVPYEAYCGEHTVGLEGSVLYDVLRTDGLEITVVDLAVPTDGPADSVQN